tara:strand:- start:2277 stop:2540 length:264 start_codon:yes stop_codon:yes gene_type:complete
MSDVAGVQFKMVCAEDSKAFTDVVNKNLSQGFLPMGQHTHTHSVTPDGVEYMQLCIGLAKDKPQPDARSGTDERQHPQPDPDAVSQK